MINKSSQTRRQFLQSSTGLAAPVSTFTIVKAESVRGTAANSKVEVGWIGLGGRGYARCFPLRKNRQGANRSRRRLLSIPR